MKTSLCKVHLGMFQDCLDGPQLSKSGLLESGGPRPLGVPASPAPFGSPAQGTTGQGGADGLALASHPSISTP